MVEYFTHIGEETLAKSDYQGLSDNEKDIAVFHYLSVQGEKMEAEIWPDFMQLLPAKLLSLYTDMEMFVATVLADISMWDGDPKTDNPLAAEIDYSDMLDKLTEPSPKDVVIYFRNKMYEYTEDTMSQLYDEYKFDKLRELPSEDPIH